MNFFRKKSPVKEWAASQRYELEHAIGFMDAPFFRELFTEIRSGQQKLSAGYRDESVLREFFGGSVQAFDRFAEHITGKSCLEIGPCAASQIGGWDCASRLIVVEPLIEPVEAWQRQHLGASVYDGMVRFGTPAEQTIPELVGAIDGAIVCRNMLDHTPHWSAALDNIAAYARAGCKLLLWTDLDHRGDADEGHYDISSDVGWFANKITQLGFRIVREYSDPGRHELNWGCFAEKL